MDYSRKGKTARQQMCLAAKPLNPFGGKYEKLNWFTKGKANANTVENITNYEKWLIEKCSRFTTSELNKSVSFL